MKRTVWDQSERVGLWVCERLECGFDRLTSTAIGIESNGEIVGGVVFDNFRHRSISMHVASIGGNWMTLDFLKAVFGYPFDQLGVTKVIAPVDSTNSKSMRFVSHLGFVLEATIKDAGRHGDFLIYTMNRAQCRFLKG